MKKYFPVFLLLLTLFFACNSDDDVLATFDGGKITRGEFHSWIKTRHIPLETIVKKKSAQKIKLDQMTVEILSVKEALDAGYDKSPAYIDLIEMTRGGFLASFYRNKICSLKEFSEDAVRVSMIKFIVKDYASVNNKKKQIGKAELDSAVARQRKRAEDIITRLRNGENFSDLAKNNSDDYSKKKSGDIGYIVKGMKRPEFIEAISSLKEGEYTQKPVLIKNNFYIIMVQERKKITNDNIDDLIVEKSRRNYIVRALESEKLKEIEGRLLMTPGLKNEINKADYALPASLLFSFNDVSYTVGDLNKLLHYIYKNRTSENEKIKPLDKEQKKRLAEKILSDRLFEAEAIKDGFNNDQDYQEGWNNFKTFSLINGYTDDMLSEKVKVNDDEVKEKYNRINNRRNTTDEIESDMDSPVRMEDEIKESILNRKKSATRQTWEMNLLTKNNYTINMDKLEGED